MFSMKSKVQSRLESAVAAIDQGSDKKITLDHLSDSAGISKYHFHRLFSGFTGIAVGQYIRLGRLKKASYQLAFRKWQSITDVAFDAGYENAESFSRAFKREYGQTPRQFRQNPNWYSWHNIHNQIENGTGIKMNETKKSNVETIDFPETKIAVLEHRGAPKALKSSIAKFIEWRKLNKLPPSKHGTFNILYDDPAITADTDYRFDLCCAITKDIAANDYGVTMKIIPAGRCARLRHVGPDHRLEASIKYLIDDWFIESDESLRDFPIFIERVSFFPEVPETQMITDIYLPLLTP